MDELAMRVQAVLGARYRVERVAATGGMSTVLRAVDLKHDRVVAVKVLHEDVADRVGTDRFLREVQLVARLQHPHIVPLFDSGAVDGLLYYTMPFIEGETLRERLKRSGPLPLDEALGIARELCDALAYAHERDILHRDVKPENILLANGHALLTDFGVARAIHAATLDRHTGTGMAVGTPAYMSPEQSVGDRALDARSDIYSLGCVVYEMLAGVAPYSGANAAALLAERFRSTPRSLRAARVDISERLDRAVAKALATDPEARFANARAFADDLAKTGEQILPAPPLGQLRRRMALSALVLLVAGVAGVALWRRGPADGSIDPALYVVLPLALDADATGAMWQGDDCARLLFDAIARWTGIRLVDEMSTRDAVGAAGGRITTLDQAVRVARRLHAGLLVWGRVRNSGGSTDVSAAVYDVRRRVPASLAQRRTRVEANGDVSLAIATVADELIAETALDRGSAPVVGSRNVDALTSYVNAHRALDRWELDSAFALFAQSAARDTTFAEAHLWAAQLAWWMLGARAPKVTAHASSALAAGLPETVRPRARALLALGSERYADACTEYDAMIARDSADFIGWFGRGDCLSFDQVVVPDRSSPSLWRFRSSRHAGVQAYGRALALVPSFQNAFGGASLARLERLMLATTNEYVRGYRLEPDTAEFAAFPALVADTLSAVPWPLRDFLAAVPGSRPPSYRGAVSHNRTVLVQLNERWASDAPDNARAQESFALALENVGRIDTVRGVASALSQVQRARAIAPAGAMQFRLVLTETRLLFKLGRWAEARRAADVLLSAADSIPARDIRPVAALALMTGRVSLAIELARRSAVFDTLYTPNGAHPVPTVLATPSYTLAAYAIAGAPADSTRAWRDAMVRALQQFVSPSEAAEAREILLNYPLMFAFPETGAFTEHRSPTNSFMRVEAALAAGDLDRLHAGLDSIDAESADLQPGDEGAEFVYLSAWLRRAGGDSAVAEQAVRRYLGALPATNRGLFDAFTGAVGIVRLLMLSADLADAAGDRVVARRDAEAVLTLWNGADPILQPHLSRMRRYLGS